MTFRFGGMLTPPRAADQESPRRSRQGSRGAGDSRSESPFESLHQHLRESVEHVQKFTVSSVENVQRSADEAKENIGQLTLNTVEHSQSFVEKVPATQPLHHSDTPTGQVQGPSVHDQRARCSLGWIADHASLERTPGARPPSPETPAAHSSALSVGLTAAFRGRRGHHPDHAKLIRGGAQNVHLPLPVVPPRPSTACIHQCPPTLPAKEGPADRPSSCVPTSNPKKRRVKHRHARRCGEDAAHLVEKNAWGRKPERRCGGCNGFTCACDRWKRCSNAAKVRRDRFLRIF